MEHKRRLTYNELKTVITMLLFVFMGFCSTPSFLIAEEPAPVVRVARDPVPDPAGTSTEGIRAVRNQGVL